MQKHHHAVGWEMEMACLMIKSDGKVHEDRLYELKEIETESTGEGNYFMQCQSRSNSDCSNVYPMMCSNGVPPGSNGMPNGVEFHVQSGSNPVANIGPTLSNPIQWHAPIWLQCDPMVCSNGVPIQSNGVLQWGSNTVQWCAPMGFHCSPT
jgi:hypothetical protein